MVIYDFVKSLHRQQHTKQLHMRRARPLRNMTYVERRSVNNTKAQRHRYIFHEGLKPNEYITNKHLVPRSQNILFPPNPPH